MKKTSLLAIAALTAWGTVSAQSYIIKDGKLQGEYVEMAYEDMEVGEYDQFNYGMTAPDGSIAAQYVHNAPYKEVRIDMSSNPLNIENEWILGIEYMLDEATANIMEDGVGLLQAKKPAFYVCGFLTEEAGKAKQAAEKDDKSIPSAQKYKYALDNDKASFQLRFTGYSVNGLTDATGEYAGKYVERLAGKWYTEKQYIYANPETLKELGALMISLNRGGDAQNEGCYIKNLWIEAGQGTRPFYAENFEGVDRGTKQGYQDQGVTNTFFAKDCSGNADITYDGKFTLRRPYYDLSGADGLVQQKEEADKVRRVWMNKMNNECQLGLLNTADEGGTEADGDAFDMFIKDIKIPGTISKIYASALINKVFVSTENDDYALATDDQKKLYINIEFNDANSTVSPLFGDSLLKNPDTYYEYKDEIDVPLGATSFTVHFYNRWMDAPKRFTYMVDNLMFSAEPNVKAEDIASVDAAEAVVYPNPAEDVVYAANAEKIEILSLAGQVVATANANEVNVANLAAGIYVAKVYSENGVAVKTIIKK